MKLLEHEISNNIIYGLLGVGGLLYSTSTISNNYARRNKRNLAYKKIRDLNHSHLIDLITPQESTDLMLLECILIDPINVNVGIDSNEVRLIRKDESNSVYIIYGNFIHYSNGYWRFQSNKIELIDNNGKNQTVSNLKYSTIESSIYYANNVTDLESKNKDDVIITGNLISNFNPNNVLTLEPLQKINLIKK